MKILYLTRGDHVDYQNDCLLIGLKELFGSDVVDHNKQSHNYVTYDINNANRLYGNGMTVTRVLPDLDVDRTDLTNKIKNHFFDFIIYGSIWRCSDNIQEVLKYYPPNKIIAVDGEDEINIHPIQHKGILYFKRELRYLSSLIFPIHFAFPSSKINFNKTKNRDIAICDPRDKSTYIYKTENDYYRGYQDARFAYTTKKAGWDCLRHYEILGNGCIPIFLDIDKCPPYTCMSLCHKELTEILNNIKFKNPTEIYEQYAPIIENHVMTHNTTKALAEYFVNKIKETQQ